MKYHPIACIFPMLGESELLALSEDIKTHGQREDVIIFEDMILDGRNRSVAAKMAGVEVRTREFKGSKADALAYVWSTNFQRRHLTSSQSAACHAEREVLDEEYAVAVEEAKKVATSKKGGDRKSESVVKKFQPLIKDNTKLTDYKLAKASGTNHSYIAASRKIRDQRPDLLEKVKDGGITISQAKTEMRRDEKRKDLEEKAEAVKLEFKDQPNWTLINSDVKDGLESVRDNHGPARLIFADPPYNIGIDYGDHHDDSQGDQQFIEWCREWMQLCCECLTDDGSLWVMINDEYAADFVLNLRDCGLHMRAWIKWYETFGVNCKNNFNRTSRHILYFVMDPDNFVFNETEVLRPSDRQTKYNDSRAQGSGKIVDDVWQIPRLAGTSKERMPDFPTQLPLALVDRIVAVASEPGDLVVDPFNGSGTTGVSAISKSRKYVGIDLSEKFIEKTEQRLFLSMGASNDV